MNKAVEQALAKVKDLDKILAIIEQRMQFVETQHEPRPCEIEGCTCPHGEYISDKGSVQYCDAGWVIRSKIETVKALKVIKVGDELQDTYVDKEVTHEYAWACPRCRPYLSLIQNQQHFDIQTQLWKRNKMLAEGHRKDHL